MGFRASATFALAALSVCASGLRASAAAGCSNDTFAIEKTSLSIAICQEGHGGDGTLRETLTVPGHLPLERAVAFERMASGTSRTIDDIALGPLGIAKSLHVTVAVRVDGVRLEHALLVPGAIPLK